MVATAGKTPVTAFRLPRELLHRVDEYAAELARTTGLRVSRAGAVTKLLTDALDAVAGEKSTGTGKKRRT